MRSDKMDSTENTFHRSPEASRRRRRRAATGDLTRRDPKATFQPSPKAVERFEPATERMYSALTSWNAANIGDVGSHSTSAPSVEELKDVNVAATRLLDCFVGGWQKVVHTVGSYEEERDRVRRMMKDTLISEGDGEPGSLRLDTERLTNFEARGLCNRVRRLRFATLERIGLMASQQTLLDAWTLCLPIDKVESDGNGSTANAISGPGDNLSNVERDQLRKGNAVTILLDHLSGYTKKRERPIGIQRPSQGTTESAEGGLAAPSGASAHHWKSHFPFRLAMAPVLLRNRLHDCLTDLLDPDDESRGTYRSCKSTLECSSEDEIRSTWRGAEDTLPQADGAASEVLSKLDRVYGVRRNSHYYVDESTREELGSAWRRAKMSDLVSVKPALRVLRDSLRSLPSSATGLAA